MEANNNNSNYVEMTDETTTASSNEQHQGRRVMEGSGSSSVISTHSGPAAAPYAGGMTDAASTTNNQHHQPLPSHPHQDAYFHYDQLQEDTSKRGPTAPLGHGYDHHRDDNEGMGGGPAAGAPAPFTYAEIEQLRLLLARPDLHSYLGQARSMDSGDSDYPEFGESTHAWAVFADNPQKRAGPWERFVGTLIIVFQLFAYRLFAKEAIEDFQAGQVPLMISHQECVTMEGEPFENFQCEANYTDLWDAFVAFFMLGIFLSADMLQAGRAIRDAPHGLGMMFACFAGIEVCCAFLAASIAVSYHLFIGEVTDAVEVGVGLLFIRELSQQTYRGIRHGKSKQFRNFFVVVFIMVVLGMLLDPLAARIFAGYIQ